MAPPRSALVGVDMINAYDHPDAERLERSAERALPRIVELVRRADEEEVLTVDVDDNFGAWTSNRDDLVAMAMDMGADVTTAAEVGLR
jgi:hypothetical protein